MKRPMRDDLDQALRVVEHQLESYEDYVYAAYVGEARTLIAELTAEVEHWRYLDSRRIGD